MNISLRAPRQPQNPRMNMIPPKQIRMILGLERRLPTPISLSVPISTWANIPAASRAQPSNWRREERKESTLYMDDNVHVHILIHVHHSTCRSRRLLISCV